MAVEFEVVCDECGDILGADLEQKTGGYVIELKVAACGTCVKKARDDGYDEGYKDGQNSS